MYQKGKKTRLEVSVADSLIITWSDSTATWIYLSAANEVTIRNGVAFTDGNSDMFSEITDGYNVSISKEAPKEWYLTILPITLASKLRTNAEL